MTSVSRSASRGYIAALVAAFLGWLFDGFEMGLFPLIGKPMLTDLLPKGQPPAEAALLLGQWFTVIIAIFLVGAATGGVLFGWLGDKLGRVKAMALAIFTFAIFSGLCAFVTQAWQFAGLRFLASLGMGGEWSLGVALVNELWAGRNRAWIAGMIGAASNVGFLLTGILSMWLNAHPESLVQALSSLGMSADFAGTRAWRVIAISGALPALINFFILFAVPESHKWEEDWQNLALGDRGPAGCARGRSGRAGHHLGLVAVVVVWRLRRHGGDAGGPCGCHAGLSASGAQVHGPLCRRRDGRRGRAQARDAQSDSGCRPGRSKPGRPSSAREQTKKLVQGLQSWLNTSQPSG